MKGATSVVVFTETLTATRYAKILDAALLPFSRKHFPHQRRHRVQQDNDPKHTSNFIKQYLKDHKVKWWKTPAESPNLNSIEKVWGSLKTFLRNIYFRKPENRNVAIKL